MESDTKRTIERFTSPDVIFLGPMFAFTLLFLFVINQQDWISTTSSDSLGPGFVPRLGLYIILAGALLALAETRKFPSVASEDGPGVHTLHYLMFPALVGGLYIYSAYAFGLMVSTVILFSVYFYVNGIRKPKIYFPLVALSTGAIYFFFMRILGIYFPSSLFI